VETIAKYYPSNLINIFKNNRVLKVHSTYQSTINFSFDKKIFSIHHREVPLNPMSIILDLDRVEFEKQFSNIESLEIKDNKIFINKQIVSFKSEAEQSCDLSALTQALKVNKEQIQQFYKKLIDFLITLSRQSDYFSAVVGDEIKNYYNNKIRQLIKERKIKNFALKLTDLIGLGKGLTPAGDDIICGFLASLDFIGYELNLEKVRIIKDAIRNKILVKNSTNDLSKEFINYALKGHHSIMISSLYKALAKNQEIDTILEKISNQGFSSGIDFLTGMYIGYLTGGNLK
jgi:hypothetical protein